MEQNQIQQAARALRRSETPYILYPDDVAVSFRLEAGEARDAIKKGLLGPWFTVNGEPAVLRETLRQHLGILISQRDGRHKELMGRAGDDGPGGGA